ncbi:hypothetical protein GCM10007913_12130 [Devosia yakushimensis]|uniref:HNH endonuclease n=1 Tax=Devosia yakushimensis TaxID=470028 RepID=A0ABQ5UFD7_9HYPH|nr:hypothetical protein [Devosia yakushimensis]GLQ09281.1 hypothetical protein GCM10007913_12130 [Devosia yakushimensis]
MSLAHPLPLKAYAVTENDENTGAVYFARHNIVARKAGANEFADGDITYVTCRRAAWADAYAETGRLPARVSIEHGWHFECCGCGMRIDEDSLAEHHLPLNGVIGGQWDPVFCGSRCARKYWSLRRRTKAQEAAAIADFKAIVCTRFPDVEFADDESRYRTHHAHVVPGRGGWHRQQVIVAFNFPGMKIGPAHYRTVDHHQKVGPADAGYTCCNGDREAFEAYAAATKRASQ